MKKVSMIGDGGGGIAAGTGRAGSPGENKGSVNIHDKGTAMHGSSRVKLSCRWAQYFRLISFRIASTPQQEMK